ncbi:MAG: hypothetical protein PVJ68_16805, partial [Candidatus Thiodiazotropha sp.]
TRTEIPTPQSLPNYPLPVVILARLALDRQHQGAGLLPAFCPFRAAHRRAHGAVCFDENP